MPNIVGTTRGLNCLISHKGSETAIKAAGNSTPFEKLVLFLQRIINLFSSPEQQKQNLDSSPEQQNQAEFIEAAKKIYIVLPSSLKEVQETSSCNVSGFGLSRWNSDNKFGIQDGKLVMFLPENSKLFQTGSQRPTALLVNFNQKDNNGKDIWNEKKYKAFKSELNAVSESKVTPASRHRISFSL